MKHLRNTLIAIILLLIYAPIMHILIRSVNGSRVPFYFTEFTYKWYQTLMYDRVLIDALYNSCIIAIYASIVSLCLAFLTSYLILQNKIKVANAITKSSLIQYLILPDIIIAVGVLSTLKLLGIDNGLTSMIIGHSALTLPFEFVILYTYMSNIDKNILDSARDMGANNIQLALRIIIPLCATSMLSAVVVACIISFDDVIISSMLSNQTTNTLPLYIMSMSRSTINPKVYSLFVLIMLIISTILSIIILYSIKNRKFRKLSI